MPWTFYSATGQKLTSTVTNISNLDIDGGTDIGAAIADVDLFIIDDGAGGTNRKTAASRLKTFIGSAVTRVGGDTSETTYTGTSADDLVAVGSISIAKNDPFQLVLSGRKTAGAASKAAVGLKINGTITNEAAISGTIMWVSSATDRAEDGLAWQEFGARDTNYLNGYNQYHTANVSSSGAFAVGNLGNIFATAPCPNDIITSITLRAISTSSVTLGVKHIQIYSRSSS